MNCSEDYIRLVAGHLPNVPLMIDVLNRVGQAFPRRAKRPPPLGQMGQCYINATDLAEDRGLYYVEGYAVCADLGIPLEHAWCVDETGLVFDPTWPDGGHYFGMAYNHGKRQRLQSRLRRFCIMGNLYLLHALGVDAVRQLLLDAAVPIDVETPALSQP